jgi:hypothetical protein
MKYTKWDKETEQIRKALRGEDSIDQVCKDYNISFPDLIKLMGAYGSENKKKLTLEYTGERYIRKHGNAYILRKGKKYFGRYRTLDDAITVRDWFLCHRWDKRWVDRACRECNIQRCTK